MNLITVTELAELLRISKSKVYELAGKIIPVYRVGGSLRFKKEEVLAWLETVKDSGGEWKPLPPIHLKNLRLE